PSASAPTPVRTTKAASRSSCVRWAAFRSDVRQGRVKSPSSLRSLSHREPQRSPAQSTSLTAARSPPFDADSRRRQIGSTMHASSHVWDLRSHPYRGLTPKLARRHPVPRTKRTVEGLWILEAKQE